MYHTEKRRDRGRKATERRPKKPSSTRTYSKGLQPSPWACTINVRMAPSALSLSLISFLSTKRRLDTVAQISKK